VAGESRVTTDHETIKQWTEERGGEPATVTGTGSDGKPGILRIHFPGHGTDESLTKITWDAFFEKFEHEKLAFLYQDRLQSGEISRFHRFIQRKESRKTKPSGAGDRRLDRAQQVLYRVIQIEEEATTRMQDAEKESDRLVDHANKKAEQIVQDARSDAQNQAQEIQKEAESTSAQEEEDLNRQAESEIRKMRSLADENMETAITVLVDWVTARRVKDG
jgi:vacuolar-type H+-ATPase subunit H